MSKECMSQYKGVPYLFMFFFITTYTVSNYLNYILLAIKV